MSEAFDPSEELSKSSSTGCDTDEADIFSDAYTSFLFNEYAKGNVNIFEDEPTPDTPQASQQVPQDNGVSGANVSIFTQDNGATVCGDNVPMSTNQLIPVHQEIDETDSGDNVSMSSLPYIPVVQGVGPTVTGDNVHVSSNQLIQVVQPIGATYSGANVSMSPNQSIPVVQGIDATSSGDNVPMASKQLIQVVQGTGANGTNFVFNPNANNIVGNQMATASYQVNGQTILLPVIRMMCETPSNVPNSPSSPSSETSTGISPGTSSGTTGKNNKRKLYEENEFTDDPHMEKKRRNAINARNHREKTKTTIKSLEEDLDIVKKERDEFKAENVKLQAAMAEMVRKQIHHQRVQQELQSLREEHAQLQMQLSMQREQEKPILQDFFDLLPDDHFTI